MKVSLSDKDPSFKGLMGLLDVEIELLEQGHTVLINYVRGQFGPINIVVDVNKSSDVTWLSLKYPQFTVEVVDDVD